MFAQLQPYLPIFEGYLTSSDKEQFFASVADTTSQELLDLLISPLYDITEMTERMNRLSLNSAFQDFLITQKIKNLFKTADQIKNDRLLKQIKERLCPNDHFDYSRPLAQMKRQEGTTEQKQDCQFKADSCLEKYVTRKLWENQKFIRQLDAYGMSKIPAGALHQLPLTEKEYFLTHCETLFHYDCRFIAEFLTTYQTQKREIEQNFLLGSSLFTKLSKQQILFLGQREPYLHKLPQFVEIWFAQNYLERLSKFNSGRERSNEQKRKEREQMIQVIDQLEKYEEMSMIKSQCEQLRQKVMTLDLELQDPSFQRLIEHLQGGKHPKIQQVAQQQRAMPNQFFQQQQQQQVFQQSYQQFVPQQAQQSYFPPQASNNVFLPQQSYVPQQVQQNVFNAQSYLPQQAQFNAYIPQQSQPDIFYQQQLNNCDDVFEFNPTNNLNNDYQSNTVSDSMHFNRRSSKNKQKVYDDDDFCQQEQQDQYSQQCSTEKKPDFTDSRILQYVKLIITKETENKEVIRRLSQFIPIKQLRKIQATAKLLKGEPIEDLKKYFTNKEAAELKNRRQIKLKSTNKKVYSINDKVQLEVQLKNISQISIKIYQINLEKHILTTHDNIDDQINLSFLKPTFVEHFEQENSNPYQLKECVITIESIPDKMGVYIVDLQGQTTTSRAVIRKGQIYCVDSFNTEGQIFSFYDQDGQPLTEKDGLRIWINDKPSELDSQNYLITDFKDQNTQVNIIASVGNYAQLFTKDLVSEEYKLDVTYIYHGQSFIIGQKAKVLLHFRLKLREKIVDLSKLKGTKVRVNLTNSQGIKSLYSFSIEELGQLGEEEIQFPLQSYTRNVHIEVESTINLQNGKKITLSNNKSISIDLGQSCSNIFDFYLEKNKQSCYVLNLLGINGESLANNTVILTYLAFGASQIQKQSLLTNEKGQIILGELNYVRELSAEFNGAGINIQRVWRLDNHIQTLTYPIKIYCKLGEEVSLPIDPSWSVKDFLFFSFLGSFVQEDLSTKLTITNQKLILPAFSAEPSDNLQYFLQVLPLGKQIEIELLKGKKLKYQSDRQLLFDKEKHKISSFWKNKYSSVRINEFKVNSKGNSQEVIFSIDTTDLSEQDLQNVRLHVLPTNYFTSSMQGIPEISQLNHPFQLNLYQGPHQYSSYFNHKTLSDEGNYTEKRQKAEGRIGNHIEKPPLFLKKQFVRQTSIVQQKLNKGKSFQPQIVTEAITGKKYDIRRIDSGYAMQKQCNNLYQNGKLELCSHNNFITVSGHVFSNIKGSKVATIEIPQNYNSLEVYILTPESAVKGVYGLCNSPERKLKDLRHTGLSEADQKSGWTMSRQVYELKAGDQKLVSRSCQWRTVGLQDIFEFAESKRIKLYSWSSHLLKWHSYSLEKKKSVYDIECCHELNTFLKFNDPPFFTQVVLPFIQNKINKTVVDLLLIGGDCIMKYKSLQFYSNLNAFEKALLVYALVDKGKKEEAAAIVEALELQLKSKTTNYESFKINFDTIIEVSNQKKELKTTQFGIELKVYVKTLTGKSVTIYINSSATVEQLKEAVMNIEGIPVDQQRIVFAGKQLQNQRKLYDYNIINESTLHLVLRLRGDGGGCARIPTSTSSIKKKAALFNDDDSDGSEEQSSMSKKESFKKKKKRKPTEKFMPVQTAKEYTERTYYQVKDYARQAQTLISLTSFWSELARFFLNGNTKNFLSKAFMEFSNRTEFILMAAFVPASLSNDYDLSNQESNLKLKIKTPLLLFVKEIKKVPFASKYGVLMNQRFYDPANRYMYEEDGTQVEKEIVEFIIGKPYVVQTVVTNTSGTKLELQLLLDIPKGAIPLKSHEYTQIVNRKLDPYISATYQRWFYLPREGQYLIEASNAYRNGVIISKAPQKQALIVKSHPSLTKLETLRDILLSGNKEEILKFLQTRNIFDSKLFNSQQILWMLKEKSFYQQVVSCLQSRQFYDAYIWKFAYFHNDIQRIRQSLCMRTAESSAPFFQYFPYYSTRVHQFADESKSTIRNVQFKETYFSFIVKSCLQMPQESSFRLALAYYLILQDRLIQAQTIVSNTPKQQLQAHEIQFDYMRCYLDMSLNTINFSQARTISKKYHDYPVDAWAQLFKEVSKKLQLDDEQFEAKAEQKKVEEFQTQVTQEKGLIKIVQPAKVKIVVDIIQLNLQLYFSQNPFSDVSTFTSIKPSKQIFFQEAEEMKENILKKSDFSDIKDVSVQITELREGLAPKKVASFTWVDPQIKVKTEEKQGKLVVFLEKKRLTGAYVKVFAQRGYSSSFYRDGYTDMTGSFKYAMSETQDISMFSIFVSTIRGGVIQQVKPPSKLSQFQ